MNNHNRNINNKNNNWWGNSIQRVHSSSWGWGTVLAATAGHTSQGEEGLGRNQGSSSASNSCPANVGAVNTSQGHANAFSSSKTALSVSSSAVESTETTTEQNSRSQTSLASTFVSSGGESTSTDDVNASVTDSDSDSDNNVDSFEPLPLRIGKFQQGIYNKPIVLIGCGGAGDELNRLASSIVTNLGTDSSSSSKARSILMDMEEESSASSLSQSNNNNNNNNNNNKKRGGIIPTTGSNARGTWVLSHSDIQPLLSSDSSNKKHQLDKSSVVVLDFDAPSFQVEEGKNSKKLTQHLTNLAKALYEDEGLLAIYVNVHPNESNMSRAGKERKIELESAVFDKYSDYEICIKSEGLDATTVMAQKLILAKNSHSSSPENNDHPDVTASNHDHTPNGNSSSSSVPANTGESNSSSHDIDMLTDPFTRMLTWDTDDKLALLQSISESQWAAWDDIEWQLQRLLARAFLPPATPGDKTSINSAHHTMGQNAFFLSLSFPDVDETKPYVEAMCKDVDAMEFRADLLTCRDDRFETLYSLQKIRTMCRPHALRAPALPFHGTVIDDSLPVVFTVRTEHQAGTYPDDDEGIENMYDLLNLGLRAGVEVLDVESAWDENRRDSLLKEVESKYTSQVLGSHHVVGKRVTTEEAVTLFNQCSLQGRAHGSKVVLSIDSDEDDHQAIDASNIAHLMAHKNHQPDIPHVSLILGEVGQFSRVINIPFTPVTHESLPFVAAPGQMTASELMATRLLMDIVPPKKFAILGHKISYSVSPAMHNAAFKATNLPHSYSLVDMPDVQELIESDLWNDENFGGMSVTIPHKQNIIPHLDTLTEAAETIGAVNTIIVQEGQESFDGSTKRILLGDNTDWKGIYNPISRKLGISPIPPLSEGKEAEVSDSFDSDVVGVALILGGGGTARAAAYAANKLGLKPVYYNRTPSKAVELVARFGGRVAGSLDGPDIVDPILEKFNKQENTFHEQKDNEEYPSVGEILEDINGEIHVVISTLPAAAEFTLPEWIIDQSSNGGKKPIIFDVNYKPYWTKLLYQAEQAGFDIVRGSEMLWEQGVGQFELWTERTAPYKVMKDVVLSNCIPKEDEED
eukprot:CAMPEP_0184860220 /NCGR_PEP_ID=MMETSP0580-20130426/5157_1 /TAXON_ID=1118495 /ORGANISM="Dactyliosolen fragilissimus" /LENGTH=1088 /DNA_ID=CAMNT_0027357255 /DNA_START=547 /DNA_END=3816 /DNA_ORIENTATION=-